MTMNHIQFQPGLSMAEFIQRYGTEAQCEAALEKVRWPEGFRCPRCGGAAHCVLRGGPRKMFQCNACHHQASLIAGTVFQSTKLALRVWFLAIHIISQAKTGLSALALKRQLGVSYPSAWLIHHKLMQAMAQREERYVLDGPVLVDDAYLGGERSGGKAGRGSENKVPFVAAVEMQDGRPQRVRFDPVSGFSFVGLTTWAKQALVPGATVTSDGLLGFEVVRQLGFKHQVVIPPRGKAGCEIEPFRWMNILLGNLKTALSGTHHAFHFRKYPHRYLAEVSYRFNRRSDLASMVPRLATALMRATPCARKAIQTTAEIGT